MGKPFLKARIRRRKPRRALPCKRFCSCCGESSIKPFSRQKSGGSSPKKQEARKFGKTAKGSEIASVEVKQLKNSRKSVELSRGCSVRAHLKQVIVNVTRLSEDVLRVLSENGSICACNVSTECKLSPSKAGKNVCSVTPTRRLRSTQIQPIVRRNVMDSLRELNADWRITACPLRGNPSSEAFDNVQEPQVSMKALFLENLSICKKTPVDEGAKENYKMHQNDNITNLVNPRRDSQPLKLPMPYPCKVRVNPFPVKVKGQPNYVRYHSLLWNQNPGKCGSARNQNMSTLFKNHRLNLLPLEPSRKTVASLPGVPRAPLNLTLSGLHEENCRTNLFQKELQTNFIISKIRSQKNQKELQKNSSEKITKKMSAANLSTKNKSQDYDDVEVIETPSGFSPPMQKPHQPSSSKSPQKSKILVDSPKNLKLTRSIRTYGMRCSKNSPELNFPNDTKPRIIRRKRSFAVRTGCSALTESSNVSNPDENSHPLEMSRRTNFTENNQKVDNSCSSPKKRKIASNTPESSKPVMFSNPNSGKPEKSHVPPEKARGIYTIILTDSSDEEQEVQKAASAKPATKKLTPIRRSACKKPRGLASKDVPLKSKSSGRSNGSIANISKNAVVVNRVAKRRNSLLNRNPRYVLSDPESEELSSDSKAEAPRYVSRTGRSVGISTGCRSCPGCKIDRPRKEKPKPKPVRKNRKLESMSIPHEDSNSSESDFYTDVVHAGSEELVEDLSQTPESPPAVVMHGLTSSESSDDELLVLMGGRTALVVVPDENAGERCPSRSEVAEEVIETHVHFPVTGVPGNPVKTVSKPTTDTEGPDADVPVKFSERALSSPNAIAPTKQLLDGKLRLKGSASAMNHIPQAHENSQDLTEALSPVVIINDDIVSDGVSCSQIPVNSKPHETQNVETGTDDQEADGLPNSPHSASEVQCYVSHHDSDGTLLLHEINSGSSSEEDIIREYSGPDFQGNENAASLGDGQSVPLLVDNSSETSDSVVNFDSQDYYTASESNSESNQAGSMPEDSCQEVIVAPEDCGCESCIIDSSFVGDDKLCGPQTLIEGDPQKEDSKVSQDTSKSPKREGETPCVTQGDKAAAGSQTFEDGLASEDGPVPSSLTETCIQAQDGQSSEEPSSDALHPGDMKKPQGVCTSSIHHSELGNSVDQDGPNTNTFRDSPQVTTTSLADSASRGNAPLCVHEPTPLKTKTQEEDYVEDSSSLVLSKVERNDGTGKSDPVQACESGDANRQDGPLREIVNDIPHESCHSSQDRYSASPEDPVVSNTEPSLQGSSTIIPEVLNVMQDFPDEADPKSGTMFQNETSETFWELNANNSDGKDPSTNNQVPPECPSSPGDLLECGVAQAQGGSAPKSETVLQNETSEITDQDCQIVDGNHEVLEIHMLEGCPSCRGDCQDPSTNNQTPLEHQSSPRDPPERPSSPGNLPKCVFPQPQGGNFYHAISNLLIGCLNNMVESVKFDNRDVIIKKVNSESPDALETDPAAQEAGLAAEDLASILKELNLPVSLNPRLTIKKLPSIPRAYNSTSNSESGDSTSQTPSDDCASNDHQENSYSNPNTTPAKSLHERKGYPTPIKKLDPTVLSVIKYNDLEIYNDEPSLNDPPESDRVECVSSKGIRLELNPEELADIENLLNTKISHLRDKGIKKSGKDDVMSFEIDELVIYNDEPSLNLTPVKRLKTRPRLHDDEDPEELVIDNDAPPLNEPINYAPLPSSEPGLNDPECMVISSDDEVVTRSGPLKNALQLEAISTLQEASKKPSKHLETPRKKLFRKRRNSKNTVEPSSIIQRSQMALRGEDPHDFGAGNQQVLDLSELDCPIDDIIDEVVIDDSDAETFHQPCWKPLPPFQSCREVLHQPQVFNRQGQPLLNLGPSGHFIDHNLANSKATTSIGNALSTSPITFDLSDTFRDSQGTECMKITDSNTLTASECGDEVIVVSPLKTSSSHVERFIERQKNARDKNIVQNVDTDSDDDVIVMSGPDKVRPVNNRFQHFPTPAAPSPAQRIDLHAQGRQVAFLQPNVFPQIRRNLTPAQFTTGQVKTVQTRNGKSYLVLVVPPKTL